MAAADWKKCPSDGTPFFIATPEYPLGRPPGSRHCSRSCAARAGSPDDTAWLDPTSYGAYYVPEVDGSLGSAEERERGGPELNAFGELARGGMADLLKGGLS